MKIIYLLLFFVNSEKIIKNVNIPSCRNCIYFKPNIYNEFTSSTNRCEKFGEKNILTDEIQYDFADLCRKDDNKCGHEGKYFEKEENVDLKILKHSIAKNAYHTIPYTLIIIVLVLSAFSTKVNA
jgi:hypothetical protein